jgi:hypothetical protein
MTGGFSLQNLLALGASAFLLSSCTALDVGSLLPYPRHPQASQGVDRLLSGDTQLQSEARVELIALGSGAVPDVVEHYEKASPETKLIMLDIIAKVGQPTSLVIKSFEAASKEQAPSLRQFVAYRASLFPELAPQLSPILHPLVWDEVPTVSAAAITTLGTYAAPNTVTSEQLLRLMSDDNLQVVSAAAAIAVNRPEEPVQRTARASLSKLVGGLQDSSPAIRASVVFAIGRFGPLAAAAIPPLSDVLHHDPLPEIQFQAAVALSKIGTREALEAARPKLEELAQSKDPMMATAALSILQKTPGTALMQQPVAHQPQEGVQQPQAVGFRPE